jgi:hypothetical protein
MEERRLAPCQRTFKTGSNTLPPQRVEYLIRTMSEEARAAK